jgi:hypothetical protein
MGNAHAATLRRAADSGKEEVLGKDDSIEDDTEGDEEERRRLRDSQAKLSCEQRNHRQCDRKHEQKGPIALCSASLLPGRAATIVHIDGSGNASKALEKESGSIKPHSHEENEREEATKDIALSTIRKAP